MMSGQSHSSHHPAHKPHASTGHAADQAHPHRPVKRVLFMCVANACRSQMAEAFAKSFNVPHVEIYSAGSRPAASIHPLTTEMMREIGIYINGAHPKGVRELPAHEFDVAISLCGDTCPTAKAKERRSWHIQDPQLSTRQEFRRIREEIRREVAALMEELAHAAPL